MFGYESRMKGGVLSKDMWNDNDEVDNDFDNNDNECDNDDVDSYEINNDDLIEI